MTAVEDDTVIVSSPEIERSISTDPRTISGLALKAWARASSGRASTAAMATPAPPSSREVRRLIERSMSEPPG